MNNLISAIIAATLLMLSGNAAAVMMNEQLYGNSGYSLSDFDMAIQDFEDEVSGKKSKKRLKKALKLDRKIERLIYKIDDAIASNKERKLKRKNRKLAKKEAKLLDILAGYLPTLDELEQNGGILSTNIPPPQPDIILPPTGIILTQVVPGETPAPGNTGGNTPPEGTVTTSETPSGQTESVPEPSTFALLGLGLACMALPRRKWTL